MYLSTHGAERALIGFMSAASLSSFHETVWMSLHSDVPGEDGESELSVIGYSRTEVVISGDTTDTTATFHIEDGEGVIRNRLEVRWGEFRETQQPTHFGFWTEEDDGIFLGAGIISPAIKTAQYNVYFDEEKLVLDFTS